MRVYHHPVPDGRSAVTLYETLETRDRLSLVEVELLTGRTHQIRASFADMGHPLLGDGKYGVGSVNRRYGETQQALYSYRLRSTSPPTRAFSTTCAGASSSPMRSLPAEILRLNMRENTYLIYI